MQFCEPPQLPGQYDFGLFAYVMTSGTRSCPVQDLRDVQDNGITLSYTAPA